MTVHPKHFKVSVAVVKILQSYAASMGVDFNAAAERNGFDTQLLKNGGATIQGLMFETLWLEIAAIDTVARAQAV